MLDGIERQSEAEKMRRVPGIVFADGVRGRVPRIEGTGLEVFEIVKVYRAVGGDLHALAEAYHWLSRPQLDAALQYANTYPDEVNARLLREAAITPEYVRVKNAERRRQVRAG